MAELELPSRYEPLAQLGKGGGGEVWAVRDRHSGRKYALKVLAEEASEREMSAAHGSTSTSPGWMVASTSELRWMIASMCSRGSPP